MLPDKDKKRNDWIKAVIKKIYPGTDGIVRVVEVQTSTGTFTRAVKGMIRLEVNVLPPRVCHENI